MELKFLDPCDLLMEFLGTLGSLETSCGLAGLDEWGVALLKEMGVLMVVHSICSAPATTILAGLQPHRLWFLVLELVGSRLLLLLAVGGCLPC